MATIVHSNHRTFVFSFIYESVITYKVWRNSETVRAQPYIRNGWYLQRMHVNVQCRIEYSNFTRTECQVSLLANIALDRNKAKNCIAFKVWEMGKTEEEVRLQVPPTLRGVARYLCMWIQMVIRGFRGHASPEFFLRQWCNGAFWAFSGALFYNFSTEKL